MRFAIVLALILFFPLSKSGAKPLSTSYMSLTIPDDWNCQQLGESTVCRSTMSKDQNSAALIITAKEANPEERIDSLSKHLERLRTIIGARGQAVKSQVDWIRTITLAGQDWVETQQRNSEIEGYISYYLASVAGQRTILVNFNYEESRAGEFSPLVGPIRDSIKLTAPEGETGPAAAVAPQAGVEVAPKGSAPVAPEPRQDSSLISKLPKTPMFWILIIGALSLFFLAALW